MPKVNIFCIFAKKMQKQVDMMTNKQYMQFVVTKFFICFLLWIIPFSSVGQRYISGSITDADSSEPIAGAFVFIDNTTAGIRTDADGKYQLKIPGEGKYQLVVSHAGYPSVFKDIEPGNISMTLDVAMHTNEMEDITVSSKVKFRQKDIHLFWKTILGKAPSKTTIYAKNPEDVHPNLN